jgi:predicted DNA-binding transcriptional regulator YafY
VGELQVSTRIHQLEAINVAPLTRQWRLLIELDKHRTQGLTFHEIARLSGCHEQTAHRDVDTLTLAGFPIQVRTGGPPRVFLNRGTGQLEGTIFNRQGH